MQIKLFFIFLFIIGGRANDVQNEPAMQNLFLTLHEEEFSLCLVSQQS